MMSLRTLSRHPDFEQVLKWFEESRQDYRDELESQTNEVTVRQAQGKAQLIKQFLSHAAHAATL